MLITYLLLLIGILKPLRICDQITLDKHIIFILKADSRQGEAWDNNCYQYYSKSFLCHCDGVVPHLVSNPPQEVHIQAFGSKMSCGLVMPIL